MHVAKPFFLVRINKSEQAAKQEKLPNGILLSSKYLYMKFNMQCGVIMDIGTNALRDYPGAEIGDLLVFKHIVESQEWRLIGGDDEKEGEVKYEYRLVDIRSGTEVHGILKQNGEWIINKKYIFLYPEIESLKNNEQSSMFSIPNPEIFSEEGYVMKKIDNLKTDLQNLQETVACQTDAYKFEDQYATLQSIANEQQRLGSNLHATKYCKAKIAHVNPYTHKETGAAPGRSIFLDNKTLYDLNLESLGLKYKLCLTEMISGMLP